MQLALPRITHARPAGRAGSWIRPITGSKLRWKGASDRAFALPKLRRTWEPRSPAHAVQHHLNRGFQLAVLRRIHEGSQGVPESRLRNNL